MPLHKFVAAFACGKACCGCFHLSGINICATHFLITPPLFFPHAVKNVADICIPCCTSSSLGISALVVSSPPGTVLMVVAADGRCGCGACAPIRQASSG